MRVEKLVPSSFDSFPPRWIDPTPILPLALRSLGQCITDASCRRPLVQRPGRRRRQWRPCVAGAAGLRALGRPHRPARLLRCDLCQVTYDSFNSDSHSGTRTAASRATLLTAAAFAVGDISVAANLYATAATSLPPGLMVYSHSREAWSKESNWIGYVICVDRRGRRQRVIYVALRGTIRNLEWVDVLKPDLVTPDTILPEGDPARGHVGVMKGWYVIYTSTDERSPFSSTARATSSWPRCGNWSPCTSRAPIHISSGKKKTYSGKQAVDEK
ncbi:hypothetical protein ZWY2020_058497 [Hordeum vulgare]|nr:hypothetical protein ZWY2020_058497 [Hordeum vulgare]